MPIESINRSDSVTELINRKDLTIFQLLTDPSLNSAIRVSPPKFISFVLEDNNMKIIMDICLTKTYNNDPLYNKYLRGAISILTSQSKQLMSSVMMSMRYINEINQFILKDSMHDNLISGTFCTLFSAMADYTLGGVIDDVRGFSSWLVKNCFTYGGRTLLTKLMINFPNKVLNDDIALLIAKCSGEESGLYVIGAVLLSIKAKPSTTSFFAKEGIVEELLSTIVRKNVSNEVTKAVLELLYYISLSGFEINPDLKKKCSEMFYRKDREIRTDVLIESLKVLNCDDINILLRVLDPKTPSLLRFSIVIQFQSMADDKLLKIIEDNSLIEKIIEVFPRRGYNTDILKLIQLLQKFNFSVEGWKKVSEEALNILNNFDAPYAGDKPDYYDKLFADIEEEEKIKEEKPKEERVLPVKIEKNESHLTQKSSFAFPVEKAFEIKSMISDDYEEDYSESSDE